MKKVKIKCILCVLGVCLLGFMLYPRRYHYDVDAAVEYLNENAEQRSRGLCARYIRLALDAGGCSTWAHPFTAKDYDDYLQALDFTQVDKKKYKRKKGDIVVFNAVKGHPYGHIAMWNGRQWISDFRQRSFYVANAYITSCDYKYYRMIDQHPRMKPLFFLQVKWLMDVISAKVRRLNITY